MNERKTLTIWIDNQPYQSWYIDHGKEVEIFGAYGSERAPKGRRKAEKVAEELLTDIVGKWKARPSPNTKRS